MNMKNIYIRLLAAIAIVAGMAGCSENERMSFTDKPAVYFSTVTDADSLSFSFAAVISDEGVVSVPVKIMGEAVDKDRMLSFDADPASTAKAGINYDLPKDPVVVPAGKVVTEIPITVYNKNLDAGDVRLVLRLIPNSDFNLGYADRLAAKVVITNQLVQPSYWRILSIYYGAYSKAKHRLCIQIQGYDFPPKLDSKKVQEYMSYGRLVYNYLLKTPIWDEETQQWVTADWSPL